MRSCGAVAIVISVVDNSDCSQCCCWIPDDGRYFDCLGERRCVDDATDLRGMLLYVAAAILGLTLRQLPPSNPGERG